MKMLGRFSFWNIKNIFLSIMIVSCTFFMTFYINTKTVEKNLTIMSNAANDDGVSVLQAMNLSESIFRWCPDELLSSTIDLNCQRLFANDEEALNNASKWTSPCTFNDVEAMKVTSNCIKLRTEYPFWNEFHRSPKDIDEYPLAYVLIGAKSAEQIIRLLQAVYHPRNIYCITYDNKTSHEFKQSLHNLDQCYDNIVMPDTFVDIYWAGFSILQTAMFCLDTLNRQNVNWKYVQILSWNDFPLRTNHEFIQIMKIFDGAQDSLLAVSSPDRTRKYFDVKKFSGIMNDHRDPEKMNLTKNIPPGNLVEFKGSLATTMSREFVDFLFTNSLAKKFYDWINDTYCPEETYWSTLIHNLHINPPGGYPGACYANYEVDKPSMPYMSRYQLWWGDKNCKGKIQTYSCVFGVRDLFQLKSRPEFMAHKLYLDFEPAIYYCLSQLHFNKTFFPDQYPPLNETFYANLPPVRYHRMKDKEQFTC